MFHSRNLHDVSVRFLRCTTLLSRSFATDPLWPGKTLFFFSRRTWTRQPQKLLLQPSRSNEILISNSLFSQNIPRIFAFACICSTINWRGSSAWVLSWFHSRSSDPEQSSERSAWLRQYFLRLSGSSSHREREERLFRSERICQESAWEKVCAAWEWNWDVVQVSKTKHKKLRNKLDKMEPLPMTTNVLLYMVVTMSWDLHGSKISHLGYVWYARTIPVPYSLCELRSIFSG